MIENSKNSVFRIKMTCFLYRVRVRLTRMHKMIILLYYYFIYLFKIFNLVKEFSCAWLNRTGRTREGSESLGTLFYKLSQSASLALQSSWSTSRPPYSASPPTLAYAQDILTKGVVVIIYVGELWATLRKEVFTGPLFKMYAFRIKKCSLKLLTRYKYRTRYELNKLGLCLTVESPDKVMRLERQLLSPCSYTVLKLQF